MSTEQLDRDEVEARPDMSASLRTSATHPLDPGYLALDPGCAGRLGFCMAPGRHKAKAGYGWARDLDTDIARLQEKGVQVLVTLMRPAEIQRDIRGNLADAVRARGMDCIVFPISDKWLPSSRRHYKAFVHHICQLIRDGKHVVVHCNGGKGRSATVSASVYRVLANASFSEAKAAVRTAVPGCFKNPLQHLWVKFVS